MRYIDIAKYIDRRVKNESIFDVDNIGEDLGLDLLNEDVSIEVDVDKRLKAYWIGQKYPSAKYGRFRMYFFDDVPVCFSVQKGLNTSEIFTWFGKENACSVREYLVSLIKGKDDELTVKICNINSDAGEGYHIGFPQFVLDWSKATLNGEPIQLMERIKADFDYGIDSKIKIKDCNNNVLHVSMSDLLFKFNVNEID